MKTLKYLAIFFVGLLIFSACKKELSFESGLNGPPAVGTLKDSLGNCQPIVINSNYIVDSSLTDTSHYVLVQVNIDTVGSYKIYTDTQNGFSFRDSGVFTVTGAQMVRLRAVGKPLSAGTNDFTVTFNNSYCLFSVTTIPKATQNTANFTLSNCANTQVNGTYKVGTPLNNSNTISLEVNVVTKGTYSITTSQINGMTFYATDSFSTTGVQNLVLHSAGTPLTAGTVNISLTAGSTTCSFTINVTGGSTGGQNPNNADSAWQFSQGANFFHGPIFDAFDTTSASAGYGVILLGYTPATGDTILSLAVLFSGGSIQPGTYRTTTFASAFDFTNIADSATIYTALALAPGSDMQVVVTSYDPTTQIITGTFSGTALNASNAPVTISNGKFRAKVR